MIETNKKKFFAAVERLDLNPFIAPDRYDAFIGYVTYWKDRGGRVVGRTDGEDTPPMRPKRYLLDRSAIA